MKADNDTPTKFSRTRLPFTLPLIPTKANMNPKTPKIKGKKMLTFNTATYNSFPHLVKPATIGKTAIIKKTPDKME